MRFYSGETITERMAALGASDDGRPIETDHIVPLSRSQDNGLNNKVLCFIKANRGKGNKTPKEWLSAEQFTALEQRVRHLELGDSASDYFTKRDCARKWDNLHRDAPEAKKFHESQLSDTAYAAKQVAQWLRDTLYKGEADGRRRVFTTKGSYTAILRRDWRLFQSLRRHVNDPTEADALEQRRAEGKDRGDHRHHAIDAVVVALTGPERIQELAHHAEAVEIARAQLDISGRSSFANWPRREPLPPPWGSVEDFRRAVLSRVFEESDRADSQGRKSAGVEPGTPLIVAHRPVKRKLIGYFHKEDLWGDVDESQGVFRIRCNVADLKPAMLRMPVEESDKQLRDRLFAELVKAGLSEKDAKKESRTAVETGRAQAAACRSVAGKGRARPRLGTAPGDSRLFAAGRTGPGPLHGQTDQRPCFQKGCRRTPKDSDAQWRPDQVGDYHWADFRSSQDRGEGRFHGPASRKPKNGETAVPLSHQPEQPPY